MKSEILPDFQSLRATCDLRSKALCGSFAKCVSIVNPVVPAGTAKENETFRCCILEFPQP